MPERDIEFVSYSRIRLNWPAGLRKSNANRPPEQHPRIATIQGRQILLGDRFESFALRVIFPRF